jgi:polyhydroxyalkanoate synthase
MPQTASTNWFDAWRNWNGGSPDLARHPLPEDSALLAGIAAYRRHPYVRQVSDPPTIWGEGGTRLLDYGGSGPPVLFVPSLVNRAYVLDLAQDHSLLRFLAEGGTHPLLLDWGWPDQAARTFTLTDYIAGRLERAIAAIGEPVTLAGYCMGGLMAVAAASRLPQQVRRLALLATPWDFWAEGQQSARRLGALVPFLEPALALGTLPVDALQMLFSLLEPGSVAAKYRAFGAQAQSSARAEKFVAIEDWLNDGVPLAAPVAREVLAGWYGGNSPAQGTWRIAGLPVRAPEIPSFVAIPTRDRIVPPGSALALAAALPGAHIVQPAAGHVGMVAGSAARAGLWQPLLTWLQNT